jgi:hypothetical protein
LVLISFDGTFVFGFIVQNEVLGEKMGPSKVRRFLGLLFNIKFQEGKGQSTNMIFLGPLFNMRLQHVYQGTSGFRYVNKVRCKAPDRVRVRLGGWTGGALQISTFDHKILHRI